MNPETTETTIEFSVETFTGRTQSLPITISESGHYHFRFDPAGQLWVKHKNGENSLVNGQAVQADCWTVVKR